MSVVSPRAPTFSPNWNANAIQKTQIMCRQPLPCLCTTSCPSVWNKEEMHHTHPQTTSGGECLGADLRRVTEAFVMREVLFKRGGRTTRAWRRMSTRPLYGWINKDRWENASENENKIGNILLRCVCLLFATQSIVTLSSLDSMSNFNGVALFLGLSGDFHFTLEVWIRSAVWRHIRDDVPVVSWRSKISASIVGHSQLIMTQYFALKSTQTTCTGWHGPVLSIQLFNDIKSDLVTFNNIFTQRPKNGQTKCWLLSGLFFFFLFHLWSNHSTFYCVLGTGRSREKVYLYYKIIIKVCF